MHGFLLQSGENRSLLHICRFGGAVVGKRHWIFGVWDRRSGCADHCSRCLGFEFRGRTARLRRGILGSGRRTAVEAIGSDAEETLWQSTTVWRWITSIEPWLLEEKSGMRHKSMRKGESRSPFAQITFRTQTPHVCAYF